MFELCDREALLPSAIVTTRHPPSGAGRRVSAVVEALGGVLSPVGEDHLEARVRDVVIVDAGETVACGAGDLVLVLGLRSVVDLEEVLSAASVMGAAAVVVKAPPSARLALSEQVERYGLAVLVAQDEVPWSQLFRVARAALGSPWAGDDTAEQSPNDLFSYANAVADQVGGPTTIEDPRSRLLAYSSQGDEIDAARQATILGHRVPGDWVRRLELEAVYRRLMTEPGVVRVEFPDEVHVKPRLAIGIRAGDEVLGSIWVAEGDTPLGETAEAALTDAARLAPHQLLRYRALDELQRRRNEELLQRALDDDVTGTDALQMLRITPGTVGAVMVLQVESDDEAKATALADRALQSVRLFCSTFRFPPTATAIGSMVYLLVPSPNNEPVDPRNVAMTLLERVCTNLPATLRIAIGSSGMGLPHVAVSRREAERVLRVIAGTDQRIAHVEDVKTLLVLMRLADIASGEPELVGGRVSELAEHDRIHQTAYVATLRAYLEAHGDVRTAAAALFVHPNTFRYRMGRLQRAVGLDLDDPTERLVAHLQLRLLADQGLSDPTS